MQEEYTVMPFSRLVSTDTSQIASYIASKTGTLWKGKNG